ncbi:hypothetical protein DPEC_G00261640 [Dallia pectoralis]|uniref:Uncharacterized protein n=1 Tax=Dallia pectoralis TaxID=75939 RepID=A0ACC2FRW6_DALPE|nr:hypothetical protein DPEC_G00261640 [Dallia pectoralis]
MKRLEVGLTLRMVTYHNDFISGPKSVGGHTGRCVGADNLGRCPVVHWSGSTWVLSGVSSALGPVLAFLLGVGVEEGRLLIIPETKAQTPRRDMRSAAPQTTALTHCLFTQASPPETPRALSDGGQGRCHTL